MDALLKTTVTCPGDGNIDAVVDQTDLDNWHRIHTEWGGSSLYDFTGAVGLPDGVTDGMDRDVISQHLGAPCTYPALAQ